MIYPLYWAIRTVSETQSRTLGVSIAQDHVVIALQHGSKRRILAANLLPCQNSLTLIGLPAEIHSAVLDVSSAPLFARDSGALRNMLSQKAVQAQRVQTLALPPYSICVIEYVP